MSLLSKVFGLLIALLYLSGHRVLGRSTIVFSSESDNSAKYSTSESPYSSGEDVRHRSGTRNSSSRVLARIRDDYEVAVSSPLPETANKNPSASDCVCVPYYQCESGKIVDDGSGIIDPRNKKPQATELPLVRASRTFILAELT